MNFGKKLVIIGLIVFGVGVPSTATSMSSPLFDAPFGMQSGTSIDGIVVYPDEEKNVKHTLLGQVDMKRFSLTEPGIINT